MIWLGANLYAQTLGQTSPLLASLYVSFWLPKWPLNGPQMTPKWPPKAEKQHKKPFFWLFWFISPKIMGLMICLGAYFYA
jgi:hypothetical protein